MGRGDYADITGYNVYMDGVKLAETAASETYYTFENLTPNTEYTPTVKAVNGTEESDASNAVTAKTDLKGTVRDVTDVAYGAKGDGKANDTVTTGGVVWNSPKTTTSNSNTSDT